jgi:ABC-type branched-subunit amino acid transport system substrate-binding protein
MWNVAVSRVAGRARSPGAIAILLLLLLATSCRSVPPAVKIGLAAPFEGRWRDVGYDAIYAARLAVREANESGGITGYRVELVALDDGGDARLAAEAAATLAADPEVLVVLGHWLPETTIAAAAVYAGHELPLLALGNAPLVEVEPSLLPETFLRRYEAITPFDEVAGSRAGATYDAVLLALHALAVANTNGPVTRQSVATALQSLEYEGLTGLVYQPEREP